MLELSGVKEDQKIFCHFVCFNFCCKTSPRIVLSSLLITFVLTNNYFSHFQVTVKEQQEWKIPPCISNWKNAKVRINKTHSRLSLVNFFSLFSLFFVFFGKEGRWGEIQLISLLKQFFIPQDMCLEIILLLLLLFAGLHNSLGQTFSSRWARPSRSTYQ